MRVTMLFCAMRTRRAGDRQRAGPKVADLMRNYLSAPRRSECHCVIVDDRGEAIYVGDIIYRSESVKLQVDLLTAERQSRPEEISRVIGRRGDPSKGQILAIAFVIGSVIL